MADEETESTETADEETESAPDASKPAAKPTETEGAKPEIPRRVEAALKKANKEAETLRLKLKEYEDRDKSELEKLTDRAATADERAAAAELRSLRLEIAHEKGLTGKQAKRLIGSTREELEADADDLLSDLKPGDKPTPPGQRPRESLRTVPLATNGEADRTDMDQWMRDQATGRRSS